MVGAPPPSARATLLSWNRLVRPSFPRKAGIQSLLDPRLRGDDGAGCFHLIGKDSKRGYTRMSNSCAECARNRHGRVSRLPQDPIENGRPGATPWPSGIPLPSGRG
jgi:hypothetical protein